MVKTPKTRHSKSHREPVTIELEPGAVSRMTDEQTTRTQADASRTGESFAAETVQTSAPEGKTDAGTGRYTSYDYSFDNDQPAAAKAEAIAQADAAPGVAAKPEPRRSASSIGAGLAGGLIALVVAGGLHYAGVLDVPSASDGAAGVEEMQAEIASLKSQIADLNAASSSTQLTGRVDGLSTAVEQVKSEVEALKSTTGQPASGDALAGLDQRIKQIETTVASLNGGGEAATEIAALNEKVAGLDAALKAAGEATKAEDSQIATLQQSVTTLAAKVEAQASQPKIALAIAASALKAAVDRGAGFTAELETFAAISPDAPELATLRAYAEKGVATRAEIVQDMDTAANTMIAAAKPVDQNAGIFERLVSSAESLVKVRPIGAVEGPGVPETVARMEAAVKHGDLAKALAEYETLPDTAKAAGADFAAKLKARLDAETLVDQLVAGAMKA